MICADHDWAVRASISFRAFMAPFVYAIRKKSGAWWSSAALSSVMSVAINWLSTIYPAVGLTFFRCAFGFIPVFR
jgi:hypothetical protein